MTEYLSEEEIRNIIDNRLLSVGCSSKSSFKKDTLNTNSIVRECLFAVAISNKKAETIINKISLIGHDEDRGISYIGSEIDPTNEGEMRYLFFTAKINPLKGT